MNYRHIYHAGNFADVIKHATLALVLKYLQKKEKPFCYIDTHAGSGCYNLRDELARKTEEASQGILKLLAHPALPSILTPYLGIVNKLNKHVSAENQLYPGSPLIAKHFQRGQDQLILNELNSDAFYELKKNFKYAKRTALHQRDAYEFLPAILPPTQGRGVILIDPPFEEKNELNNIDAVLKKSLKKFPHGIYLVWYALTEKRPLFKVSNDLKTSLKTTPYLEVTFNQQPYTEDTKGLFGTTLLIINPPFTLVSELKQLLPFLANALMLDEKAQWTIKHFNEK